jgi:hypothetical protein
MELRRSIGRPFLRKTPRPASSLPGEHPKDIKPAIERAIERGQPALVKVCTDPDAQAVTDMGFAGS